MSMLLNLKSTIGVAAKLVRPGIVKHDVRLIHSAFGRSQYLRVRSNEDMKLRGVLVTSCRSCTQAAQSSIWNQYVAVRKEERAAPMNKVSSSGRHSKEKASGVEKRSEASANLPDFLTEIRQWFNMEDLLKARVHLGHKSGCRNSHMSEFIYGERLGVDVFNLEQTLPFLQDALNFVAHCAYRRGVILLRAHQPYIVPEVESFAQRVGEYAHCRPWQQGTLTNTEMVFGTAVRHPDCVVAFTALTKLNESDWALTECAKSLIPTVAVCDSNADPRLVTYVVPGNDDSPASLRFYISMFERAIKLGKRTRKGVEPNAQRADASNN